MTEIKLYSECLQMVFNFKFNTICYSDNTKVLILLNLMIAIQDSVHTPDYTIQLNCNYTIVLYSVYKYYVNVKTLQNDGTKFVVRYPIQYACTRQHCPAKPLMRYTIVLYCIYHVNVEQI